MSEKTYEWGRAGRLRAARDYLGLSTREMAEQIGMSRNSYQRMETGAAAVPVSLWDNIYELHDEFDAAVRRLITATEQDGMNELTMPERATKWERAIVARAARQVGFVALDVQVPDDAVAREEMRE
ncbi:helix-turn-helix domain-containing protein [Rhodococcus spongiicola]|uniref:XRE family transcriptional regulator n=1 Tax=Rhodococcus spongiicola TaxID=2487352 RepID=A0A3S3ANM6_9NOCA|nr:helix-turn-helix transcriptional regulator [Rhodococcus spongiicola]RVW04881.1 XRE family transcriptional regulator [Rhodococcus spongiicola]